MEIEDHFLRIVQSSKEAELELCELLDKVDSESMLSIMIAQLLVQPVEQQIGDRFGQHPVMIEIIAEYCIPRFGNNVDKNIPLMESNACYGFLNQCIKGRMFSEYTFSDHDNKINSVSSSLKMDSEIIRGSAYPEQTREEIIEVQGKFDQWFQNSIGISPSRAIEVIYALIGHLEDTFQEHSKAFHEAGKQSKKHYISIKNKRNKSPDDKKFIGMFKDEKTAEIFGFYSKLNEIIPIVLPIDILDLVLPEPVSEQESEALKMLIGISRETYTQDKEIQRHPLYILTTGKVLISELSNCLDVLWDSFEKVAKSEIKFFDKKYQKHKSRWLEKQGVKLLKRIFPNDSIYTNLDYPDPYNVGGTAELDIAVKWGSFILLVEAKASQFRFESIRGDVGRLRTDIKKNIENAYKQSLRVIQYINSSSEPVFIEKNTERKLKFKRNKINRIYPFSLTLHHLGGIATELNKTKELGLFDDNNYPFSICLADLKVISDTNISPDIFLHYIEKRLDLLSATEEWNGDELDLIAAYFDCRLNIKNMPVKEDEIINIISFTGYSSCFDELYLYERGLVDKKPVIGLSIPTEIQGILDQLRTWDDDGARWISFVLLGLDDQVLLELAHIISELKNQTVPNGIFRRYVFSDNDVVISITGSSSANSQELKERVNLRATVEKYRRKLDKSIGFGIFCHPGKQNNLFDTACYIEHPWHQDGELESLLNNEPMSNPDPGAKMPGRNDKCICGSGKKFKKCCLRRIELHRRNNSTSNI